MPMTNQDPLRIRLHEVEEEIHERVKHVCGTPPPRELDTGAMIRFEEALSIVASAAKEAVSLRRRLRIDREGVTVFQVNKDASPRDARPGDDAGTQPSA
jgi:hypothetical protein